MKIQDNTTSGLPLAYDFLFQQLPGFPSSCTVYNIETLEEGELSPLLSAQDSLRIRI
jgi:hypothetical protein